MHHRVIAIVLALLVVSARSAGATPLAQPVRAEIETLLGTLPASGCQFNRGETWHAGAEAQSHLLKKLDYLDRRGLVRTTEEFIALGASASSMSSKPYLVRCGTSQPVESKTWLQEQLKLIRQPR